LILLTRARGNARGRDGGIQARVESWLAIWRCDKLRSRFMRLFVRHDFRNRPTLQLLGFALVIVGHFPEGLLCVTAVHGIGLGTEAGAPF
jgi:hypothetical protein